MLSFQWREGGCAASYPLMGALIKYEVKAYCADAMSFIPLGLRFVLGTVLVNIGGNRKGAWTLMLVART